MKLRDRLVFAVANLERGAGPALYVVANEVVPRVMHLSLGSGFEMIRDIPYQYVDGEVVRLDVVRPRGEGPFPVVVGIHGGAWMLGRKENIRHSGTYLARRGIMSVLINYRLALEHPWPACAEDVTAALRWVKTNAAIYGGDPTRVGIYGDSAGGHLAAYGALKIAGDPERADDLPQISALACWYGVFDMAKFSRIPWRRTPQILGSLFPDGGAYSAAKLAAASPRSYLDSATRLPPTILFAAGADPLYSQSTMFARELRARGCDVVLKKYMRNIHGFLNLPLAPECRASLRHAATWFRAHLS